MIQKPSGAERESRAHEAVGDGIRMGGQARDVARKGGRMVAIVYLYWFLGMMVFGLLVSSTPFWFKAIGLLIFAGIFYAARSVRRAVSR